MKWNLGIALALAWALLLPVPAFAVDTPSNSDYLFVDGYTVQRDGKDTERVRKDDKVTVVATIRQTQLITSAAGKVSATVKSDSFRIGKDSKVSVAVDSGDTDLLTLKLTVSNIIYKGTGDSLRFQLTYGGGAPPDHGEIHLFECIEYEKPKKEDPDEDDKPKKVTHYGPPVLLISRGAFESPLKAGETFQVKILLRNASTRLTASNLVVSFEPSEGITLLESTASQYLRTLRTRKTEELIVLLRAEKDIQSPSQSLGVSVKYDYVENDERASSTVSEKLFLPFDESIGKGGSPTPNLIVSRYNYGDQVAVGDTFDLTLAFRNTSPETGVENIVLSLDTTDGLSIADGSNTFYFPALAPGGSISQKVRFQAVPQEKQDSPKIEISFKYEYMDGAKRSQATASERIAIPVVQPDRFQVSAPNPSGPVLQNEETTITLPYVNKGKGQVYNVEAALEGDLEALEAHQNLGNFEPGRSGTIDFVVTPHTAGAISCKVIVSYEDANTKLKKLEFPLTLQVEEAFPDPDLSATDVGPVNETPTIHWAVWAVGAGALTLLAVLLWLRRRRRKKQPVATVTDFSWEPEGQALPAADEEDPHEAQ